MDPQSLQALLIIIAVFTGIAALAMIFQAAMLFGVMKSAKAMQQQVAKVTPKVELLIPKLESLADSSKSAVDEGRARMQEITQRATDILDITQRQLVRVDTFIEDAAGRARVQLQRAEMVVDDAMNRTQETVAAVQGGIMKPIREINGVAAGVRAAIHYFTRGGRPTPDQVTADEEMFI